MSLTLPSPAPTPDGALPTPTAAGQEDTDQAKIRAEVEGLLLRLSQDLYEMEICAGDVGQGMENAVPTYLYVPLEGFTSLRFAENRAKINAGYIQLQQLSARLGDSVPRQVVEQIDQFRNPHTYTKNTLSRASGENQYALGRVLGLESFRRQLQDAIGEEFPDVPLPERRHQPIHSDNPEANQSKEDAAPVEHESLQPNGNAQA